MEVEAAVARTIGQSAFRLDPAHDPKRSRASASTLQTASSRPLTSAQGARPTRVSDGQFLPTGEVRMSGSFRVLAASVILGAGACTDFVGGNDNTLPLNEAFQTVPAGFGANSTSFETSADAGTAFMPGGDHHDGRGNARHSARDLLMGGGLGPDFIGAIGFGHGRGRGP